MPSDACLVVGSGPAGVACARALLDLGLHVTMIDVGRQPDEKTLAAIARVANTSPELWTEELLRPIKGPPASQGELPLKLAWGSDFIYSQSDSDIATQVGTKCVQSFAQGGLSHVWGGAMLPHRPEDLHDWPVQLSDLAPHYSAVGKFAWLSGRSDSLDRFFPFYGEPLPGAEPSRQALHIERTLESNRAALEAKGIVFGRSRLALKSERGGGEHACRNTGLCMTGCPYFAIWSAAIEVAELAKSPRFTYLDNHMVETVSETDEEITVHCRAEPGSRPVALTGRHIFLAAGVMSTVRIIMQSIGRTDTELSLKFHPYFLLPMKMSGSVPNVTTERLHALAQIFLEIFDRKLSKRTVHLQLYTYNELVRDRVHAAARRLPGAAALAERLMLGRLLFVQGYLHSDESAGIIVRARPNPQRSRWDLELKGTLEAKTKAVILKVAAKLTSESRRLGAVPLLPLMYIGKPGEGNHIGGVFPMRATPGPLETDTLGRLPSFRRLSIVDASVLPSLPATTLTYTAMANAHRIGSTVGASLV